ncbi:cytidylyltransferase domain-containing protein [Occallatibacter savannae]|uniref:acylneuraminate cytidylyltransferase family protein n=1 Tax=Occallatibacter savannae TaxID=1002691 RepID=UPI000D69BDA4|nr:acylneuraminate cytidylyltransferase family protein [Occallatibacter savannae]
MSSDRTAIAIIPARGGSKRVPGKNIRPLGGKELIGYTIEAAASSGLFERVVVSTDSEEIAAVAAKYGAETPFLRAREISDDVTPVSAATADALERLDPDGSQYDFVAQLMANCPLRTAGDLVSSFEQFVKSGADSQISIVRYGWQNPWWAMRRDESSFMLDPLFPREMSARSQDLPELFCPTGAIWWGKTRVIRELRTFHIANRTGWEIDWRHGVDIDTPEDMTFAEVLLGLIRNQA